MDTKEIFDNFLSELKTAFPDIQLVEYNIDQEVKVIEDSYYQHALKILQKDETFFAEERSFCSLNLSELWRRSEEHRETIWKYLTMVLIASFLHGDISSKIGKFIETAKGILNSSGQQNDEISKILNDENAEDHFKELFEFVKETRLAKLFMELVEETNIEEIAEGINLQNPTELVDMIKDPEHPKMKTIVSKIQQKIQLKMQQGQFTQQQMVGEVESIKAKVQNLFGNYINEMLGGRRADVPASTLMANSPEARRQRMIARLQRKQREKNSR